MRVIKSDSSGIYAYQKLFKHVHTNNCKVVVWQVVPSTGEREVANTRINSFHLETGLLHFELPSGSSPKMDLPIYCYSENGPFIFKTNVRDVKSNVFTVSMPAEVQMLEDPDVNVIRSKSGIDLSDDIWKVKRLDVGSSDSGPDIMRVKSMSERSSRDQEFLNNEFDSKTLDEEEKMFADKRESPRARPKIDKFVKVMGSTSSEVHYLKLFDLSRGGIGFVSMEPHLFAKGTEIKVVGFDSFDLDDALIGKVMSHRPIDDTQIEFKIGCKFNEGQV